MAAMQGMIRAAMALALAGTSGSALAAGSWRKTETGVEVTPEAGPEKAVRLQVYGERIVRVSAAPAGGIELPESYMVVAKPQAGGFSVAESAGRVTLSTGQVQASVDLANGNVSFTDAGGQVDLAESAPAEFAPVKVEGRVYLSVRQQFNRGTDEGLYGLGQHQNGQMDYNGEDVELLQHNIAVPIPFLVSTRNYGLLWDNNSITRFGNPKAYAYAGDGTDGLKVAGEDGKPGWTARYYLGDRLALARAEATVNYQYIRDQVKWLAEAKAQTVAADSGQNTAGNAVQTQRVVWTGRVTPDKSGLHRFRLYSSSYAKVFVDGRQVLSRWRQNWNPWYHNFDVAMTAGRPADIRIEWEPNAGYIALRHSDPRPQADRHSISFASEAGRGLDYYYVGGKDMDGVIAGYRQLTGKAVMLPKWAYGFWQSRQRYQNQDEVVGVVEEYRKRRLPLDNIVQDWFYWREDDWGSHRFDPKRFPDPKGMIERVHALGARFMISVWPKFYPGTDTYKELAKAGAVYTRNLESGDKDWVGAGYLSTFYDPYSAKGRAIYWRQMKERLAALGVDAWWMDATEPDMHSNLSLEERAYRMGPTADGLGGALFNSYPLVHAEGVYDGWRAYKPDVRPFILTRAGWGGLQRTGSAVWSGDVASRWDDLREQIAAGVNFSMSGIPNWTHDIGGFALEERYQKGDPEHLAEWRELNLRWFQFGAFSPLFRSHGEAPKREIYELSPEGSPTYQAMAWYDRLRYRLMPYIYTLAADTYHRDGTIMRGLSMDFPADPKVRRVADQYLFGPAFLVAPVTRFKARSRGVYLPAGTRWFDFHSGRSFAGGRTIEAPAPYAQMPLFVRAGSIVPMGPEVQSTAEDVSGKPVTLHVYTGADGAFSLYEDDGVSMQYGTGAFSRVPIRWNEKARTLTLGAREGSFPGMAERRSFRIVWNRPGKARALALEAADAAIVYEGRAQVVKAPF
ncbi:MAG TPA: TIM-barrel domain-containing protein [Allosphingosinicella sp.]|jgi:alpha-D-xyloside xylohydrolase